ncbi:MAG: radical SAM protein [Acidobacteria bacterium]|nr:radical SAM protein [Acidobacteriota bacterium]
MPRALLISTYDLGHQPFGLASPAAWLRRGGAEVACADLSKQKLDEEQVRAADVIAFHLPMHTATRMASGVIRKVREINPHARIAAYGLYAPINAEWLRSLGVADLFGAEFEAGLTRLVCGSVPADAVARESAPMTGARHTARTTVPRLQFIPPDRTGLLPLARYATLRMPDGTTRVAGYTEASRGCRHLCRHCPVVPIYGGQFRVVPGHVVLADVRAQVDAGAQHITFGDPDFFNGPRHALQVVQALRTAHPHLTYDVTIKIEHLLRHRDLLPTLRDTGCLFITSAVESIDDRVLEILDKGHTRADFVAAVTLCRDAGVPLVPTFVAFHPWITMVGYCELLTTLTRLDLIAHVAPIQLAIRLLIPSGSRLLEHPDLAPHLRGFERRTLTHLWQHPDPEVDRLQADVAALVGRTLTGSRRELFGAIAALASSRAGVAMPSSGHAGEDAGIPQFDEPWYCCAEPNPEQLTLV